MLIWELNLGNNVVKQLNKPQYLTVIREYLAPVSPTSTKRATFVVCKCICGNEKITRKCDFLANKTTSCGCAYKRYVTSRHLSQILPGTVFGSLTIINKTKIHSTEGYKYLCSCDCGNTIEVYANRLKRGETKSCGCKSSYYNSVNNGGNGIAYSYLPVQQAIRACEKYQKFIKDCLIRAKGKSELSNTSGQKLHVHHLNSVSYLIKKYNLTLESYLECDDLFSMDNAIVLTETEHRKFHSIYNKTTTASDWFLYIEKNTVKLTELNL